MMTEKQLEEEYLLWDRFKQTRFAMIDHFMLNTLMTDTVTKDDIMKLKLSIFEDEIVKKSKNKELLSKIKDSQDAIDIIMYYGMIRKDNA